MGRLSLNLLLRRACVAVPALWCCHGVQPGQAASPVSQPPLDLGQTSFLDGEGGPGLLLETVGLGSVSSYATDASGRALPGSNKQWSGNVTLHAAYASGLPVLGGKLGIEFLFPFSLVHMNVPSHAVTSQFGAGDVTVSPYVQWLGSSLLGKPFSSRLGLQGVVPSGSYSPTRLINAGNDVWQVSPYFAFTWRPLDRWELSARLIYDWSSSSSTHPLPSPGASSVQPGSQFAANYAASYAVSPNRRLGLAGYTLHQLDDTRVAGRPVAGSRQQVFGIGPGLLWTNGPTKVIANVFREFGAENRPEGVNAVTRLLLSFRTGARRRRPFRLEPGRKGSGSTSLESESPGILAKDGRAAAPLDGNSCNRGGCNENLLPTRKKPCRGKLRWRSISRFPRWCRTARASCPPITGRS